MDAAENVNRFVNRSQVWSSDGEPSTHVIGKEFVLHTSPNDETDFDTTNLLDVILSLIEQWTELITINIV